MHRQSGSRGGLAHTAHEQSAETENGVVTIRFTGAADPLPCWLQSSRFRFVPGFFATSTLEAGCIFFEARRGTSAGTARRVETSAVNRVALAHHTPHTSQRTAHITHHTTHHTRRRSLGKT